MALAASQNSNDAAGTCSTAVSDAGIINDKIKHEFVKTEIKTEQITYKNEHDPNAIKKLKQ